MFAQIDYPDILLPEELDDYLAKGWFRMRQSIFTTNFLHFDQQFYSAIWLRIILDERIYDKKFRLLRKRNQKFRTEIARADIQHISEAHETLFQYYRNAVHFDASKTLVELLTGNDIINRFDTYVLNMYDDDILIAAGFFDIGEEAAAGLTSIYHPLYKKYSLGKYLIYLKLEFCKKRNLKYFYPGYVVPGYKPFDYKLAIAPASLQYLFLATGQWVNYQPLQKLIVPLQLMLEKLRELQALLNNICLPNAILFYKFFEVPLDPYYESERLFDFPVMICLTSASSISAYILVVYNICLDTYILAQCIPLLTIGFQQKNTGVFDWGLLKRETELFRSASTYDLVARAALLVKQRNKISAG